MADQRRWLRVARAVFARLWTCLMLAILFVAVVIITLLVTRRG